MASSPTSTTSSDLYAASEPTEEFVSVQFKEIEQRIDQVFTPVNGDPWPTAHSGPEMETVVDAPRIIHGQDMENSDGYLANSHYKRKREEESDMLYSTKTESESPGPKSQRSQLTADGHQTRKVHPSSLSETSSGTKRIKTNGYSPADSRSFGVQVRADILPAELWHHVFRFVPPVFLGRLLRVNRAFHSYLTSSPKESKLAKGSSDRGVQPLDAETIWAASRKRFAAGLPKPLRGLKELDMWRLLRGQACQICGNSKNPGAISGIDSPWEAGPGDQTVRVIWSFGVRSCGPCLEKSSKKVLTSSMKIPLIHVTLLMLF